VRGLLRGKRALSPVIAVVVLVSVTIVVAVSVAYWMGSIAGTYTRFEKLEISSAYSSRVDDWSGDPDVPATWGSEGGWTVRIVVKNSGSADATIDDVFIDGIPYGQFSNVTVREMVAYGYGAPGVAVGAGATESVEILVRCGTDQDITFSSGSTLDIKLHTAAGKEYPRLIELT
jgi:flagellin-like protein